VIGVIDASLALSWMFEDEQTPLCMSILQQVSKAGAVVPGLWRLEVANSLQTAVKRKRIEIDYRDSMIQKLLLLPIEIDSETNDYAWTTTLKLAETHKITVYDASYLELTLRRSLPLATRDDQLAAAASRSGAILIPTR
jgi:predicted nucleic acid-binding protein